MTKVDTAPMSRAVSQQEELLVWKDVDRKERSLKRKFTKGEGQSLEAETELKHWSKGFVPEDPGSGPSKLVIDYKGKNNA